MSVDEGLGFILQSCGFLVVGFLSNPAIGSIVRADRFGSTTPLRVISKSNIEEFRQCCKTAQTLIGPFMWDDNPSYCFYRVEAAD